MRCIGRSEGMIVKVTHLVSAVESKEGDIFPVNLDSIHRLVIQDIKKLKAKSAE